MARNFDGTDDTIRLPLPLPVSCDTCPGACCHGRHRPPFNHHELEADPALAAEIAAIPDDPTGRDFDFSIRCAWLTVDGWCSGYDRRPRSCRDHAFPVGGEGCLACRDLFERSQP